MTYLPCDYLVVGGGASDMAFVDELLDIVGLILGQFVIPKKLSGF